MLTRLTDTLRLRRLPAAIRDERGAVSVEAAVMLPVLAFLMVAGFQWFKTFHRDIQITKATYAISDVLSRERGVVTPQLLDDMQEMYEVIVNSLPADSHMRFSEVRRLGDRMEVIWSYASDNEGAMTNTRIQAFLDQIPTLDQNERIVLVEAFTIDRPIFNVGLPERMIDAFVPVSHRYDGRLAFDPDDRGNAVDIIASDNSCASGGSICIFVASGRDATETPDDPILDETPPPDV